MSEVFIEISQLEFSLSKHDPSKDPEKNQLALMAPYKVLLFIFKLFSPSTFFFYYFCRPYRANHRSLIRFLYSTFLKQIVNIVDVIWKKNFEFRPSTQQTGQENEVKRGRSTTLVGPDGPTVVVVVRP